MSMVLSIRPVAAVVALIALGACEQESQTLPFEVTETVTRAVGAQGGSVSTPAGAAIHFPAGAISGSLPVSVAPTTAPAVIQSAGTAASEVFRIEPVGQPLEKPAHLELKLSGSGSNRWLATVVSAADGDLRRYPGSRVDLSTGVVTAGIDRLGVVAAVTPPPSAVFPVSFRAALSLSPAQVQPASRSVSGVTVACGGSANPCSGLTVTATQNLLDLVEEAAVVYPQIQGALTVSGATVTGEIRANASLRVLLESGQTAESVEVTAQLRPTAATTVVETAGEVRFTNILHRISGSSSTEAQAHEEVATLVVPRSGTAGSVTITRTFQIEGSGGRLEAASITLTFPITIAS